MQHTNFSEVTILLPTYNRANFLMNAIESALNQTYQSVAILVADDASTDDTANIVVPYVERGLVRYLRHPCNLGICGNWHESIAHVQTPFFCILHDDDTFEPEFVETLIRPLKEDTNLAFAFCDHWLMDADGRRMNAETDNQTSVSGRAELSEGRIEAVVDAAVVRQSVPIGATIFRREVFTPDLVNDRAGSAIDFYVLYRCVRLGNPAYYVDKRLMNYRCHDSNISAGRASASLDGLLFTLKEIEIDTCLSKPQREYFERRRAGILAIKGNRLLREKRTVHARQCFQESLQAHTTIKALGGYMMSLVGAHT